MGNYLLYHKVLVTAHCFTKWEAPAAVLCLGEGLYWLACRGRPSLRGSVPEMESLRSGPLTATPQRCSVAYLTRTECCGKLGKLSPAERLCVAEPHR